MAKAVRKNLSIGKEIERVAEAAKQADRGLSKVLEAWKSVVPVELSECCRPTGLRAGTLEIACDSSAATYEVNRWLKSEGVAALAREGVPVLRVRLVGTTLHAGVQSKAGVQPEKRAAGNTSKGGVRRPRT